MTEIKLECGQTWLCNQGTKREIVAMKYGKICYWMPSDMGMWAMDEQSFRTHHCATLVPKTVRKSQCVVKDTWSGREKPSDFLFVSREEAEKSYSETQCKVIMWPLVVNGVEQWIEVDCD